MNWVLDDIKESLIFECDNSIVTTQKWKCPAALEVHTKVFLGEMAYVSDLG